MKLELAAIRPDERTPLGESLLAIIRPLLDRVQQLEETVQQLRDDNAIWKGQKPRPPIRPRQRESSTPPAPAAGPNPSRAPKRSQSDQRPITPEEVVLPLDPLVPGAVLTSYAPSLVQELTIQAQATCSWRARYQLPTGASVLAPLPAAVLPGRHFGPNLLRSILHQYDHAHVPQPLLLEERPDFGLALSSGALNRLLTENQEVFHQEKDAVREAGRQTASYIGTDDTGARHQGRKGYCTAIGNDLFACFESTDSKSRLNFLQVLHGRPHRYAIKETTRAYGQRQELAAALMEKRSQGPRQYTAESAWAARLDALGITGARHRRMATAGAWLGGLIARGVSPNWVVLRDGAPPFDVLVQASCGIHAERPLARRVPDHDEHRTLIAKLRQHIGELDKDLKAYQQQPDAARTPLLEARFDALGNQPPGSPSSAGVLKEIRDHQADLLGVLERPEVPLHNNAAESEIRE
jgi:hypothetical protein